MSQHQRDSVAVAMCTNWLLYFESPMSSSGNVQHMMLTGHCVQIEVGVFCSHVVAGLPKQQTSSLSSTLLQLGTQHCNPWACAEACTCVYLLVSG
jgi:hypothetical protein